jgi:N-acetyl-alpha-D-muramate 1-phosphate uridylyltransferase
MKAMILAAGRGERMRPLTDATAKPLLRVGGRALIEHHILALAAAGVTELVINLAWHGAQIREFLDNGAKYGVIITYSEEPEGALETGGGIQRALPLLGDAPFWLVNGDVYCAFDYPDRVLGAGRVGHLLLVPNPAHHPRGDFGLDGDDVVADAHRTFTYSGIALLDPALFAGSSPGRFPLAPMLVAAMSRGAISGEVYPGRWVDVGTPERLEALDRELGESGG